MLFDINTIKHLGLQMYSTLPPVIGELVANAWDADAEVVEITVPIDPINTESEIVVWDDGAGMSDADIREAYMIVGRDRRRSDNDAPTPGHHRKVIGRKGIGKFSAFGIAGEIEVETIKDGETSRFIMNYAELEAAAEKRRFRMPPLPPTRTLKKGTRVTLRGIVKFKDRRMSIQALRRALARRFSIIGAQSNFTVSVNGDPISPTERDLKALLEKDADGNPYLWEFDDVEIEPGTGWTVSGWIGALTRTTQLADGIDRGIVIMARGKLVQEPFIFGAEVGQQFALSYLIGELHAEFVDGEEDRISTTRNSLVWDSEPNAKLKEWGRAEVNKIARKWADRRRGDNERELAANPVYTKFVQDARRFGSTRVKKVADKLIRQIIRSNPLAGPEEQEPVIQMFLDYMEFDEFHELAGEVAESGIQDIPKLFELFREWQVVEAKEMMRVTEGRIQTIQKLQQLIEQNALEVPTLHNFLKEFPWVLDPRWNLIADETRFTDLLRNEFPDDELPEEDRRIDFLCVSEGDDLVVVEIKRPGFKASDAALAQIQRYVNFMRDYVSKTTDPSFKAREVVGYLLCGHLVDTFNVRETRRNLEKADIYVRRYSDLLRMVERIHRVFLKRYDELRKARNKD
jgi:hypothetical protein